MNLLKNLFRKKEISNELSAGDIILLWVFESGNDIDQKEYSGYFQYKYNIDAKEHADFLKNCGYIVKADLKKTLESYKLSDIKELCREKNLKSSGKKETLIASLCNIDNLENEIHSTIYQLSSLGEQALKSNYDFVKYHKNSFDIDLSEFSQMIKKYGNYESVIRNKLSADDNNFRNQKMWGLLRNNKLNKARFSKIQGDNVSEMLYYIETFYFDLSGFENSGCRNNLKDLMIAPGIVNYFSHHKDYYDSSMIHTCIIECNLEKHYFSENAFRLVIEYLLIHSEISIQQLKELRRKN